MESIEWTLSEIARRLDDEARAFEQCRGRGYDEFERGLAVAYAHAAKIVRQWMKRDELADESSEQET